MGENEITIKVHLAYSVPVDNKLYMDIINGLNDRYIPCNEIYLNGDIVFNNVQGFASNKNTNNKEE